MARIIYCLDTSILIKAFVAEEGSAESSALLRKIISGGHRLIMPAFARVEVGSVLWKKVRAGLLSESEARATWRRFLSLATEYVEGREIQEKAWEITARYNLSVMYDAVFLAVCEIFAQDAQDIVEFWTADRELVLSLVPKPPEYVRLLHR